MQLERCLRNESAYLNRLRTIPDIQLENFAMALLAPLLKAGIHLSAQLHHLIEHIKRDVLIFVGPYMPIPTLWVRVYHSSAFQKKYRQDMVGS